MTRISKHRVRRTAAGVLAGALALSGAVLAGSPAVAGPGFALERIEGEDRYETSARIGERSGPATGAILASGETGRSVDALSANFLAGVQGVPVLLIRRDRVPAAVMARLNALTGAKSVTIVGGPVAVSAAVETQLRGMGFTVTRLHGADRYATSEEVITAGRASASPIGLLASGRSFPDALAGAPLSHRGKHPVFLTAGSSLPQDTLDAMVAADTRQVIILGGVVAVPASVEAALVARGISVVERLGGAGRSETSRVVADYLIDNMGFTKTTFNLASGAPRLEGVDALSGGALSGTQNRALLITDTVTSAAPVVAFARDRGATLDEVGNIFGGRAAVAVALEEAIEAAGRGSAGNFQTLDVVPQEAVTLQLADEAPAGTAAVRDADNRTYTVSGLTSGTRYRITLVNAASIQGTGTGRTFLGSAIAGSTTSFGVDLGADVADIVAVNGATPTDNGVAPDAAARTATAVPVAGSISFEIDGTAPGTVVPAVHVDGGQGGTATTGGADVRLETSATATGTFAAATETLGLGGATTFVNPAAVSSTVGTSTAPVTVQSIDRAANQFVADGVSLTYDANDVFRVGGSAVTLEQFEGALSSGDTFWATYSATAGGVSTFDLNDTNPSTPTSVAAQAGTGANSNDITVTVAIAGDADSVVILRAPVTGTGNTDEATTGSVGAFVNVGTVTVTAAQRTAGSVVFVDADVPVGSYRYQAAIVNDGQQGSFAADPANETSTTPVVPLTATGTVRDVNANGTFEDGDPIVITFTEAVKPEGVNSSAVTLRITDADGGTTGTITCSTACTLNSTNTVLTIPNATFPAGATGAIGANGFQGDLTVSASTGLVAADDGVAVAVPFTLTRVQGA